MKTILQRAKNYLIDKFVIHDKELRDRFRRYKAGQKLKYSGFCSPVKTKVAFWPDPRQSNMLPKTT